MLWPHLARLCTLTKLAHSSRHSSRHSSSSSSCCRRRRVVVMLLLLLLVMLLLLELGRFSKNGRSPIFRFYVSLFPISDSDPIFTVAEIALASAANNGYGSVCCPPFSRRFRSTDNVGLQIHGQFSIHQCIWRRARPMGQRVPSSLAAARCGVLAGGFDGSNRAS